MNTKVLESQIKKTEDKLEILERQREELLEKVEKKREEVRVLRRVVRSTKGVEKQMD